MIYDISHVTTYTYETPVGAARGVMRLLPREGCAGQRVLTSVLHLSPPPERMSERRDFFGNRVVEAQIGAPHVKLRIALEARVEIERRPAPAGALTPSWEDAGAAALAERSLAPLSPAHWLFPSRLAPLDEAVTAYARESFPSGRPALEAAGEFMRRIHADFVYDPDATHVGMPLARAFRRRSGVCQDFAHVMIAGLRGVGLPAAYVSGYIRTIPVGGQARLEGADASHAWVAVWCGPAFGWLHLDPTNAAILGDDHIIVAIGRDYADVSPIDGVIHGSGKQALDVRVDVIPTPMPAERLI